MKPRSRLDLVCAGALLAAGVLTSAAPLDAQLVEAASAGDLHAVTAALDAGADPNQARGDGITALHAASERGQVEVVVQLLRAGADVAATTRIGAYTPLHLASRGGYREVAGKLLAAGADPRAKTTNSGVTPLHLAAAAIDGEGAVELLLDHGADPDARESTAGQTPLMFAAAAGRTESVRVLLGGGADPSIETRVVDVLRSVATDQAASRVLRETIEAFRAAEGGGRDWEPTPAQLREAIRVQRAFLRSDEAYGDYDPTDLISHRPDYPGGPDIARRPYRETLVGMTGGMTALLYAAREGHVGSAMALLDGGADIDQVSGGDRTSALLIAALNGQFDMAMRLIERGADPNLAASTDGATPLFAALQTQWAPKSNYPQPRAHDDQRIEYLDVLRALLEAGADPNVRLNTHLWYWEYGLTKIGLDLKGATPFYRAALAQDVTAMRMLAEYGADANIPTSWPEVGMRERRQQDGRQQEDSGLPHIPENASNAWSIHAAAGGGWLGLGAFSMRAVPNNFLAAVEYLVEEHGADVNLRDSWGYTPLHYAASRGDNEMIEYLVAQGADVRAITRLGQSTADMARGGRAGFFSRVAYPETVELLQSLGSTLECLHTHFLDTGDFCPGAGVNVTAFSPRRALA
jgi:ankyrin repeat protein